MPRLQTSFLFDLDGTLVDSVYEHVLAWRDALDEEGIDLSVWRIHRKIGMSGGLFANQLLRETDVEIDPKRSERLRRAHAEAYQRHASQIRPLPGARKLLTWLTDAGIPWAIATSGRMETAAVNLAALEVDPAKVPVVTRDEVKYAKPDPDLFLAAAARLHTPIERAIFQFQDAIHLDPANEDAKKNLELIYQLTAPPNTPTGTLRREGRSHSGASATSPGHGY